VARALILSGTGLATWAFSMASRATSVHQRTTRTPNTPVAELSSRTVSEPLTIRKSIDKLLDGTIRIPGFQRPYVWDPSRAALLMDSLYKGYPIGSLLLWRTKSRLKTERKLGVFELPPPDEDYPVDYVLDGQQRLTSIFSTFQTTLTPAASDADLKIRNLSH
jgi:hypothetical protein